MSEIDWAFISSLESSVLTGYVPKDKEGNVIGHSGVTIATGIDLGQMDVCDLVDLLQGIKPYPMHLIIKLKSYLQKKGASAVDYLKFNPLELTVEEASTLDHAMYKSVLDRLKTEWLFHTKHNFNELPIQAQTVLFSLAWNFGVPLSKSLSNTWLLFIDAFVSKKWARVYNWLKDFPSKNKELIKRRKREAEYIKVLTTIE